MRSGFFLGGSFDSVGSFGVYWSSTVSGATGARDLYFDSTLVDPAGTSGMKDYGFSVRCVAP
jgi:hypothetical protein